MILNKKISQPKFETLRLGFTLFALLLAISILPHGKQADAAFREQKSEAGYLYQKSGDYSRAIEIYRSIPQKTPTVLFRLGESYLLIGDYKEAVYTFQRLLKDYPDSIYGDRAVFLLATSCAQLGDLRKAIRYYKKYRLRQDLVDDYVSLFIGNSYAELENFGWAILEYRRALKGNLPQGLRLDVKGKIAESYLSLKYYRNAIYWYLKLYKNVKTQPEKAKIKYQVAVSHQGLKEIDLAVELFQQITDRYQQTPHALLALKRLREIGLRVADYCQQGLIYYHNRLYKEAVDSFYLYLAEYPSGSRAEEALYYSGLSYRKMGRQKEAVEQFSRLINISPNLGKAWMGKAVSLRNMEDYARAISTYRKFQRLYPTDELADDALWRIARLLEDRLSFQEAAMEYHKLSRKYPSGEFAKRAIFREGLNHYRLSQYKQAAKTWEKLLSLHLSPDLKSKALFWTGKVLLKQERLAEAEEYFKKLTTIKPRGYYALRAGELKGKKEQVNSRITKKDFKEWLTQTSDGHGIKEDFRFARGDELLKIHLRDYAETEFRLVINKNRHRRNPHSLYRLSLLFQERGLYHLSILCAERVARLSPAKSIFESPKFLQRLSYPIHFKSLVAPMAEEMGIDPLLFFSLIRQESMFDRVAVSRSDARGLTQVMPSTGKWIAEKIGKESFELATLFRPHNSVKFGAWYLSERLRSFDNNTFLALAAYNGGIGNVRRWLRKSGLPFDQDLFMEDIRFSETRTYLKRIYQHYSMYRELYPSLIGGQHPPLLLDKREMHGGSHPPNQQGCQHSNAHNPAC